jgi:hypothetical protein
MMPLLKQKGAPAKFTGHHEDVKPFIEHFNQLAATYGLNDSQKCNKVTIYCSRSVIDLLEALASYKSGNWIQLEKDLLKYYDADRVEIWWLKSDLETLTRKWRDQKIENMTTWKKYECPFITIAGWLEQTGRITTVEKARFFWEGINHKLRTVFENKLTLGATPLSTKITFPMNKVMEVAETMFERDRFDRDIARSTKAYESLESDATESDKDDEDESEEEDLRDRKKKKKKAPRRLSRYMLEEEETKQQKKKKERKTASERLAIRESARQPRKELDALIRDLEDLSLNDRRYGVAYFKALKIDPDIAQCFQAPSFRDRYQDQPPRRPNNIMEGCRPYAAQAQYTGPNNQEPGPMQWKNGTLPTRMSQDPRTSCIRKNQERPIWKSSD